MKQFVSPDSLRKDSYLLASKVVKDEFMPTHMIALWRGEQQLVFVCMNILNI